MKVLVLGGIKSGKTRFAEQLAGQFAVETSGRVAVIATAQALDGEMAERIQRHKAARNPLWLLPDCRWLLKARKAARNCYQP